MSCNLMRDPQQTAEDRAREIQAALAKLQSALGSNQARYQVSPQGFVSIVGWREEDRRRVSDVCAFRMLATAGSWEHRKALAAAESRAGRAVNVQAIGAGVHSHDGGKTFHPGH